MAELAVGDLLIVRFAPMNLQKLQDQAQDQADELAANHRPPEFSISTFGLVRSDEVDSVDDIIQRLTDSTGLKSRWVYAVPATALTSARFEVRLSEPPPDHYDVVLGDTLEQEDLRRLVEILEEGKRRHPSWSNKK